MLRKFAVAWVLMWGMSYIMVAMAAPWISEVPALVYGTLGGFILFALFLRWLAYDRMGYIIVRFLFYCLGVLMVAGGIMSWTGVTIWNVPFENLEIFQVSMAFADLLGAVFMFVLATEPVNPRLFLGCILRILSEREKLILAVLEVYGEAPTSNLLKIVYPGQALYLNRQHQYALRTIHRL